jgi:hypothetical protein
MTLLYQTHFSGEAACEGDELFLEGLGAPFSLPIRHACP